MLMAVKRTIKRVPMDFDYPIGNVWYGYQMKIPQTMCFSVPSHDRCHLCKSMAKSYDLGETSYECPSWDSHMGDFFKELKEVFEKNKYLLEPPIGDGYQLWEHTSEGSPLSPVFSSKDDLLDWCSENETIVGKKLTKEEWENVLQNEVIAI